MATDHPPFRIIALLASLLCLGSVEIARAENEKVVEENDIPAICKGLDKAFAKRNWGSNPCRSLEWKSGGKSVEGRPLMYLEFGPADSKNTTLVFAMVHGDEYTPLYQGFEMVEWALENMKNYPSARLVIAPLVNPDGFFDFPKTRMNAHGVDCNRNFPTRDWDRDALRWWNKKFRSDKRRYPGPHANSEPETAFQMMLIEKFSPQKILSIHSPLNVIDYDGPDGLKLEQFSTEYVKKCMELRAQVKAKSTGFFPGSLGNYAGQEMGIPTITLELPTALATEAKAYWKQFKKGMVTVVTYEVPPKKTQKKEAK